MLCREANRLFGHRCQFVGGDLESGLGSITGKVASGFEIYDDGEGCQHYRNKFELVGIEETPKFLEIPHVFTGYRVYFSKQLCAASFFKLHNESGNIWTHALGLLMFAYVAIDAWINHLSTAPISDKLIFSFFFACTMVCTGFSTTYHLFRCHSEKMHDSMLKLDFVGITSMILGSYVPGLYYGFFCEPFVQHLYCGIIILLCVVSCLIPHWAICSDTFRTSFYILMVLFSVIPICHWILFLKKADGKGDGFLIRIVEMLLYYAAGFFFYHTKLPESQFPGKFDIWLHSHQIWHIFIVAAGLSWANTLIDILVLKQTHECVEQI